MALIVVITSIPQANIALGKDGAMCSSTVTTSKRQQEVKKKVAEVEIQVLLFATVFKNLEENQRPTENEKEDI